MLKGKRGTCLNVPLDQPLLCTIRARLQEMKLRIPKAWGRPWGHWENSGALLEAKRPAPPSVSYLSGEAGTQERGRACLGGFSVVAK